MAETDLWVAPERDDGLAVPRRVEVASVDVWSMARVLGGVYGGFGVIGAGFMLMMAAASPSASASAIPFAIAAPVLYGVLGAVGGAVSALVYNLVASAFGGVRFELQ